jgi:hypothetical protein
MPSETQKVTDSTQIKVTRAGESQSTLGAGHSPEEGYHEHEHHENVGFSAPTRIRNPLNPIHIAQDLSHLFTSHPSTDKPVLDWRSFLQGYKAQEHPVEYKVIAPDGTLKQRVHSHNVRTNLGGFWQTVQLGGGAAVLNVTGTYTSGALTGSGLVTLATTVTTTSTTQYVGNIIEIHGTSNSTLNYGVIVSHTSGANASFTVDRWYNPPTNTGSVSGTTYTTTNVPLAGTYYILSGQSPAMWLALSTYSSFGASAASTVASTQWVSPNEQTGNGLIRARATYFPPGTVVGGSTLHVPVGTSTTDTAGYALAATFTYTGVSSVNIYGSGLFDSSRAYVGQLIFEAALTTSATLATNDTLQVTWTITC